MTERITALLQEEADDLAVPAIDAGEIIADGRRMRRRRSALQIIGAGAVVGVIAAGAVTWTGLRDSDEPRATSPGGIDELSGWAIATGGTIKLQGAGPVEVDGQVKSLYYTSEGVLVRAGKSPYTDVPGGSHYSVLNDDGQLTDLGLTLGDQTPATDPDEPYVAYSEPGSGEAKWTIRLVDVRTGEVAHSVSFDGAFTWAGWDAPPISLDGDHVYAGMDEATLDINWRDGSITTARGLPRETAPDVRNGKMLMQTWAVPDGEQSQPVSEAFVVDVASGDRQDVPIDLDQGFASLSPDGTELLIESSSSASLYDLATGESTELPRVKSVGTGWTPGGGTLQVGKKDLTICGRTDASYGCQSRPLDRPDGELRIAGNSYES